MKKIFFLLIYPYCAMFAQTNNNSVLWKISGNGLKEASYLFGTIHIVPKKQFIINDSILKCLDISKRLVLEINTDIPIKKQIELSKHFFLPSGGTIKDYYNDSQPYKLLYYYLRDSLKIKDKKLKNYFRLKPFYMEAMVFREVIGKSKSYEIEF